MTIENHYMFVKMGLGWKKWKIENIEKLDDKESKKKIDKLENKY